MDISALAPTRYCRKCHSLQSGIYQTVHGTAGMYHCIRLRPIFSESIQLKFTTQKISGKTSVKLRDLPIPHEEGPARARVPPQDYLLY